MSVILGFTIGYLTRGILIVVGEILDKERIKRSQK